MGGLHQRIVRQRLTGWLCLPAVILVLVLLLWACSHTGDPKARKLWLKANRASFERQYDEALGLLQAATRKDPDFAEAWVSKGMVYRQIQKDALARKCYEVARFLYRKRYQDEPDNIDFIKGYAQALSLLGEQEEALKVVDIAIARFPEKPTLIYYRSLLLRPNPLGFSRPSKP